MSKSLLGRLLFSSPARGVTRLFIACKSAAAGVLNRAYVAYLWPDSIARDAYIHTSTRVKYPERIRLGQSVRIGPNCVLGGMGGITLGDHARLSEGVCIETGGLDFSGEPPYTHIAKPTVIGNGVWLGFRAVVLAGVTIGDR